MPKKDTINEVIDVKNNLSFIRDNAKLVVDKLMEMNPTREQIADFLCETANHYCLGIDETAIWEYVNEFENFESKEFFNDEKGMIEKHGTAAVEMYGLPNWIYNSKVVPNPVG